MKTFNKILILEMLLSISSFVLGQIPTANLKAWYIGDSVVLTSGYVSEWTDYSGNNYHLQQSNSVRRPSKTSLIYNSHSAVRFDGSNDYLTRSFGETVNQPVTIFVVWKKSATQQQTLFDGINSTGQMSFGYPYGVTQDLAIYAGGVGVGLAYSKTITSNLTVSSLVFDATSKVFDNGVSKGSSNLVGSHSIGGLTIGSMYDFTRSFNGDIVEFILYNSNLSDANRQSIENYLMNKYAPSISLGPDIEITYGLCDTILVIDPSFSNILWSTSETNDTIFVNQDGTYFVQAKDIFGRMRYDTISVSFPDYNLSNSKICLGDSVLYNPNLIGSYDYLWSDASTESTKYYKDEGSYWLRMEDSFGCFDTVFFSVDVDSFKNLIELGNDTALCSGNSVSLVNGEELCSQFLWTPGNGTLSYQVVTESGWQKLNVQNEFGCVAVDSLYVTISGTAPTPQYFVNNLCFGDNTEFTDNSTPIGGITTWKWIFNSTDTIVSQNCQYTFESAGNQQIGLYVEGDGGCSNVLNFEISINENPVVEFSHVPICPGYETSINSSVDIPLGSNIDSYSWYIDGSLVSDEENLEYTFVTASDYSIELLVSLDNSCFNTYVETITVPDSYPVLINPVCVYPTNNIIIDANEPEFSWNNIENVFFYEILIADDALFSNILYSENNIIDNDIIVDLSTFSDTIFWKIRAYNPCFQYSESNIESFVIYSTPKLSHLKLWSAADSVLLNSGFVETMYDKSGNNFHFSQSNLTKAPILVTNSFNNRQYLKFDGSNDFMKSNFGQSFLQPATIVVLWRNTLMKNQNVFDSFSGQGFSFYFPYAVTNTLIATAGSIGGLQYNKPISLHHSISTMIFSPQSKLFENGLLKVSGSDVGSNSINGFTIGSVSTTDTRFLNGEIAEIVYYDTVLNEDERLYVENYLHDKYFPPLNLGFDIRIPYGFCDTTISTAYKPWFTSYLWSTGETDSIITVNKTGIYSCTVTDIFGYTSTDNIRVYYPQVNDFADTTVCFGESVIWDTEIAGNYSYAWYGSTELTQSIEITTVGDYAAIVSDSRGCSYKTDTISFNVDNYEFNASIGPADTLLCSGNSLMLISNLEETISYNWSTGSTSPSITLETSDTYLVTVTNWRGCNATDLINVSIIGTAPTPNYTIQNLCFGDITEFIDNSTPEGNIALWEWIVNTNDTLYSQNAEFQFTNVGQQNISFIVADAAGCSSKIDFEIIIKEIPDVSFSYNPVCTGLELTINSNINIPNETSIESYSWTIDGLPVGAVENLNYTFETNNNYLVELEVMLDNNCSNSYEETVSATDFYPLPANLSCVLPINNCINSSESINFSWNQSDNTLFYEIVIAEDSLFNNVIFTQSNILSNNININLSTSSNSIFWKIKAYNPCLTISESETFKFLRFSPSQIQNLELWSSADSVLNNSGYAEIMYDLSGNDFNFTQSNFTKRPSVFIDAFNNQKFLGFDGNNDFMKCDFGTSIPQPATIFIIWKNNIMKSQNIFGSFASPGFAMYFPYSVTNTFIATASTIGGMQYDKPLTKNNTLSTIIFNSVSFIYDNSVLKANTTTAGTNSMDGFTLGSTFATDQRFLNGNIAEIIFYDTVLSDTDRQMVERYLHDKYFPPVNLGYDIRVPYGFCDTAITTAYKPWFTSYAWSTGETDSIIHVNRPGVYSVTVTDIFGFESSDDIRVFYPEVNDFADTVVCYGGQVVWDLEIAGDYTYEWYGSSETSRSIDITTEGLYAAVITDTIGAGCKYYTDTISFSFDNYEFTASVGPADTSLCAGNRLMLVTNSPETVSYLWNTGSTSPEIVLASSGTYSVTTTNWRGCEANDAIDVTITGTVPVPLFSSEGHCAQNPVYFTDLSTSSNGTINSWTWSINGNIFSTDQNPVLSPGDIPTRATLSPESPAGETTTNLLRKHNDTARLYRVVPTVNGRETESSGNIPSQAESNQTKSPTNYQVQLTISTDAGCSDFLTSPLTIYPLPTVSFVPNYFCQWAPVEFSSTAQVDGGTITENIWDFNGTQQTGDNILYVFTQSGNNPITLTSTSDVGCRDSLVTEVYVKNASLPVFSTENACEGSEIYFVNNTEVLVHNLPLEWNWDFGDGRTGTGSDPAHIYENAGIYDVAVTVVWQNMCEVPATAQVEVYHNPSLSLQAGDECINVPFSIEKTVESLSGDVVNYNWTFGSENPQISANENPQFSSSVPGEYPVNLNIETEFGCVSNAVDTVIVHGNPHASFTASRVWGAVPMEVEFTNNSSDATGYMWKLDETSVSFEENPVHVYTTEGEFEVKMYAYSQFGCEDDTVIIIKSVIPILDVILYDLRTVMSGNYLQTNVYVINNGTLPVNNAEITLDLGDGKIFRENIEYLAPSQVLDYKFNMEVYRADGKVPEVVCTEIYAPPFEGYAETTLDDNVLCSTDVETLRVYQPYPNPATGELNVSFILESESDVTITLINGIGEQVYKNSMSNKTGYQKHIINVGNFTPGVYYLQITAGDEVRSFKVEVL